MESRFTKRVQLFWIFALGVMFVLIGQAFVFTLYKWGLIGMIIFGLTQISVSNVPPDAPPRRFWRFNAVFGAVIIVIFGVSIWLAPILTGLGR
jgi:hypothetical protein